jgi:flagellar basal body-associated protein FliL
MHITPAPYSGGGKSKGTYIKAKTGEVVREPGAYDVLRIYGSWKLIAAVTKTLGQKSGKYEWEKPFCPFHRKITVRDFYTIFRQGEGGFVICRYDPKAKDAGQFTSVRLLPRQWSRYVKPALTYLQKNLERLQEKSPKVTSNLKLLLSHKNPFVAATACNILAERNGLDRDFVRSSLFVSRGYRQAIFTYLLLTHPLRINQVESFEEMSRIIELADNSEQLAGAALGIFASFYSGQPESRNERENKLKLLEKLDKKQLEFGQRTESDKYIISILEMMRIHQEEPVPNIKKEKATRKR